MGKPYSHRDLWFHLIAGIFGETHYIGINHFVENLEALGRNTKSEICRFPFNSPLILRQLPDNEASSQKGQLELRQGASARHRAKIRIHF